MRFGVAILVVLAAMSISCGGAGEQPPRAADAAAGFKVLYEREWEWRLHEDPLFATSVGDHRYDDRLPSETPADFARRATETGAFLAELARIDRGALAAVDQMSYDIFKAQLEDRAGGYRFREELLPLNADSGFHTNFALIPEQMRFGSADDYRKYVGRLHAFPRYVDENIALMREGLHARITVPRESLAGIDATIRPLVTDDPTMHALWGPFAAMPATLAAADRDRLQADGRAAIADAVVPAYRRFLEFMTKEYVPGARATLGADALPNGTDYYTFLVRRFTTLDLTPDQIHQVGLDQVKSIRQDMDRAIERAGFKGTFQAFLTFLRTDARFYPKTADELLKDAAYIAKRMDGKLPSLFGRLPRQPYGVVAVPDYLAPKYTAGRYNDNPIDGIEPGYYWVNTYALDTRPLYNLEALTLHESVPGHHLQIALAKEMERLPPFRRFVYVSAFGEGWGLYSEWLGLEAGFYADPYSDFGRLTYAMWRAARLVVDTGLHTKGWTRQQAIDYLASNTALSIHECTTETDRYISWPGQALSYKIGELKIRELRRKAEQALGGRFDVRRFHDAVLGEGSVPLPILERVIDDFISTERTRLAS